MEEVQSKNGLQYSCRLKHSEGSLKFFLPYWDRLPRSITPIRNGLQRMGKLVTWWPEVGNRFFLVALSLFVLSCNCAILRVKWKAYSPPRFSRYRWLSLTISLPPPPYKFLWIMCWVGRREVISPLCSLSLSIPATALAVKPCMEWLNLPLITSPHIPPNGANSRCFSFTFSLYSAIATSALHTPKVSAWSFLRSIPLWKLSILVLIFHPSNPSTSSTKNLRFR